VAFGAGFKPANSKLDRFVTDCKKVESDLFDYYACPKVERFSYATRKDLKSLTAFLEKKGIHGKSVTSGEGFEVIEMSIQSNISVVSEYRPGFETEDLETFDAAFSKYENIMTTFLQAVSKATKNSDTILVDKDTYWAPSVNAKALVLVNHKKQSVTIIWHGDTDG
jgi:hypothetical protein